MPAVGDDDLRDKGVDQLLEFGWIPEPDCFADVRAQDRQVRRRGNLGDAEQGVLEFVATGAELVGLLGESVDALAALFAGELLVLERGQVAVDLGVDRSEFRDDRDEVGFDGAAVEFVARRGGGHGFLDQVGAPISGDHGVE